MVLWPVRIASATELVSVPEPHPLTGFGDTESVLVDAMFADVVHDERPNRWAGPAPVRLVEGDSRGNANDPVEQLMKLTTLRNQGAITEAEFAKLRKRILDGYA